MFASAALAEKIQGISYTYPDEPGQDSDIPHQDPLRTKLTDGNIGAGGGSAVWGQWQGNKAIVRFDLKRKYNLSAIEIWTREDSKDQHLGRVEILSSTNGSDYRRVRTLRNPREPLKEKPLKPNIYSFGAQDLNVEARYLKLTFYQDNLTAGIYQQVIEEVYLWGEPLPFGYDQKMPPVEFTAKVNTYSSVRLEIGDYLQRNPRAADLRVFVAEEDFRDAEGKEEYRQWWYLDDRKQTVIVNGLTPNHTYYIAAAGLSADDKQLRYLEPAAVRLPGVLAVEKVGDVFGVNAFPYIETGSSHQMRSPEAEREMFQLQVELAQEAGIKYNRWWRNYPSGLIPYVNAGVTYQVFLPQDAKSVKDTNDYGSWLFGAGNETNLSGTQPTDYVKSLKEGYQMMKAVSPENMLAAPVIHSIQAADWLRGFYQAGGKDYFDVMDIHIYQQSALPVPEGLPQGSPEGMLLQVAELKKIMKEYGDQAKPLITTETGCPTYTGRSWAVRGTTQEQQANNIVRMHLHLIASGFRRIFWYAFQDEGTDLNNMEHNFGVIDYHGKPKLAYYAYKTMLRQLGETLYHSSLKGAENPYYGYSFKKLNGEGYISCLWDAAGKSEAILKLAAEEGKVIVSDLFGSGRELTAGEQLTLTISESPIYIHTKAPIVVLSAKRLPPPPSLNVSASLPDDIMLAGEDSGLSVRFNSTLPGTVSGNVSVEGPFPVEQRKFAVTDETILALPLVLPKSAAPGLYALKIKVELPKQKVGGMNVSGVQELKLNFWLAAPADAKPAVYKRDFTGDGSEQILLTNEKWEILLAPEFGGRLILLIDKASKTNQLNADFADFSKACTGAGLGLWDALGSFTADLWNGKYEYNVIESERQIGINLQATGKSGVRVNKQLILPSSEDYFAYKVNFTNPTGRQLTVNYSTHPEFTPGGTADSTRDSLQLPTQGGIKNFPYVSALGERGSLELTEGWYAIADSKQKVMLGAVFEGNKVKSARQWWGDEAFNLELTLKPFQLAPGEAYEFDTLYFIKRSDDFQTIRDEWLKRK
jgi:hypothetical protein